MDRSATFPKFVWIACTIFVVASLDVALFAHEELKVWLDCAECRASISSWSWRCWMLIGGGVWVVIRTYLGVVHWLTWWYRLGRWLPESRGVLETLPTTHAVADAVWTHPGFGVFRPWANLDPYCRLERVEMILYAAFGTWVWWQLSECSLCPRWIGDAAATCGRYAHLALAPFGVLLVFAILRAYFGSSQNRPN